MPTLGADDGQQQARAPGSKRTTASQAFLDLAGPSDLDASVPLPPLVPTPSASPPADIDTISPDEDFPTVPTFVPVDNTDPLGFSPDSLVPSGLSPRKRSRGSAGFDPQPAAPVGAPIPGMMGFMQLELPTELPTAPSMMAPPHMMQPYPGMGMDGGFSLPMPTGEYAPLPQSLQPSMGEGYGTRRSTQEGGRQTMKWDGANMTREERVAR